MYPVLVVDDEVPIAELISITLSQIGLPCVQAHSGSEAADLIESQRFDLILLDVMLPDVDGFQLMDYIRPTGTPVIFLTARTGVNDRVRGRRDTLLRAWDVVVDPEARTAAKNGVPVPLTPHEFDLLLALLHNRGITLYRSALLELVWGMDADPSNRTLDIHMSRLRRKLGWENHIRTVPRIGYMLEEENAP